MKSTIRAQKQAITSSRLLVMVVVDLAEVRFVRISSRLGLMVVYMDPDVSISLAIFPSRQTISALVLETNSCTT